MSEKEKKTMKVSSIVIKHASGKYKLEKKRDPAIKFRFQKDTEKMSKVVRTILKSADRFLKMADVTGVTLAHGSKKTKYKGDKLDVPLEINGQEYTEIVIDLGS